jgi:hypothetical protein
MLPRPLGSHWVISPVAITPDYDFIFGHFVFCS